MKFLFHLLFHLVGRWHIIARDVCKLCAGVVISGKKAAIVLNVFSSLKLHLFRRYKFTEIASTT